MVTNTQESHFPPPLLELQGRIRDRKITKEDISDPSFVENLEKVSDLLWSDDEALFWLVVATLGRTASFHKAAQNLILPILEERLSKDTPAFIRLPDSMDRYYVATVCDVMEIGRFSNLAFQEIASEETGEKAREVWVRIALKSSLSLSSFLRELNGQIRNFVALSLGDANAICRRVRRITVVIFNILATSELDAGDCLGEELQRFFVGHLPRSGPDDKELRDQAAIEFSEALGTIIRLNFSARLDPSSYVGIGRMRSWWGVAAPPEEFEKCAVKICRYGLEAILVDARQGIKNIGLRNSILQVIGKKKLKVLASEVSTKYKSISSDIEFWILHGFDRNEREKSDEGQKISEASADDNIARLLISIEFLERKSQTASSVLEDIKDIFPEEAKVLSDAHRSTQSILQWARAAARARRISLNPNFNDIVDYDPLEHDTHLSLVRGAKGRVVVPGVVRMMPGGVSSVIIKAQVEPDNGH